MSGGPSWQRLWLWLRRPESWLPYVFKALVAVALALLLLGRVAWGALACGAVAAVLVWTWFRKRALDRRRWRAKRNEVDRVRWRAIQNLVGAAERGDIRALSQFVRQDRLRGDRQLREYLSILVRAVLKEQTSQAPTVHDVEAFATKIFPRWSKVWTFDLPYLTDVLLTSVRLGDPARFRDGEDLIAQRAVILGCALRDPTYDLRRLRPFLNEVLFNMRDGTEDLAQHLRSGVGGS